ncbi:AzlC family ABC transporter permease [Arthrobacter psychrolactophilus]|uniref:AzlC family ABC transporter permease n=1 Tax=Arthrobacter psychrolactophilus TaxID=92442 RepID=UPI0015E88053|nr:AzlC family ABC transporter permease [Arthrobacter psychrolactophilus]
MCLSVLIMGISYGLAANTAGVPLWGNILLAVLVLAGSSEFLFVAAVGAGVPPILAAATSALVNTRHLVFGFTLAKILGKGGRRWIAAHLINDEAVALAIAEPTPERRRLLYWATGLGILLVWPVGALLGGLLGGIVPDPRVLGIDAVLPAVLIAVAIPALKERPAIAIATLGTGLAIILTPFVPAGIAPILALTTVPLAMIRKRVQV